jgi:hypothetical protein
MQTKPVYSNCFFGLLYLAIRRKISKLVFISSNSPVWPVHFVAKNRNGHIIHFGRDDLDGDADPWWYEGCYHVLHKEDALELLIKHDRVVYGSIKFDWRGKLLLILLTVILITPWIMGWFLYPSVWLFVEGRKLADMALVGSSNGKALD